MTQKDKELLLKDLCARLPYEVKVQVFNYGVESVETLYQIDLDGYISTVEGDELKYSYKPYLFPMSSMTEEQEIEYDATFATIVYEDGRKDSAMTYKTFDWLNENHFDYHGLISMGLAIDATGKNIY